MAHGGNVVEGLQRHDEAGEFGLLHRAVAVGDGAGLAGHAFDRMQRDEARAVGLEFGLRLDLDREDQAPVILRNDVGAIGEDSIGGVDARVVAHAKAVCALLDLEIRDLGRVRLPARAAHDEGEATQGFHATEADPAQLAGVERGRERAGTERLRRRNLVLRAIEPERLGWSRRHVRFPDLA